MLTWIVAFDLDGYSESGHFFITDPVLRFPVTSPHFYDSL